VPATTNDFTFDLVATGDWKRDAFSLLAGVYGTALGAGEESVPFSSQGKIEPELLAIRR
jgi:hypothetical protein